MRSTRRNSARLLLGLLLLVSLIATSMMFGLLVERLIGPARSGISTVLVFALFVGVLGLGTTLYQELLSRRLPIAYHIALIGFPKSGKTTLITALFNEIFSRQIVDIDVKLSGTSTIERVNSDIAKLKRGQALGPTTDQDLFAYRTTVQTRSKGLFPFLPSRTYKVEIGDFPGENSEQYAAQYGPWLHNTPFFKWTATADAYVFVVDLAKYALDMTDQRDGYVAEITSAIRAAWQQLVDVTEGEDRPARRRKVALVFTKTDAFEVFEQYFDIDLGDAYLDQDGIKIPDHERLAIFQLGFGLQVPPIHELDKADLDSFALEVQRDFADLIRYLKGETSSFSVVLTSCFGTVGGARLGLSELVRKIFPSSTDF